MQELSRTLYANRLVIYVTIAVAVLMSLWLNGALPKVYEARASFYVPVVQDIFSLAIETGGSIRAAPAPTVVRDQLRGYFGILTSQRLATRVAESVPERAISQIRRVTRFRLKSDGMFLITATDRDPILATRIANAYADSFNDLFEEISLPRATKTRKFIEAQLQGLKTDLATTEKKMEEFKEQHKVVSLPEETSQLVKQVTEFHAQTDLTTVNLDEVRTRLAMTEKHLHSEAQMQPSSEVVATNPLVQHLQMKLSDLEIDLAGLQSKFPPSHPDVLKAQQQILETRKRLQEEVRKIVASETRSLNPVHENLRQSLVTLYADETALAAKLAGLQGITRRIEAKLEQLPDLQRRLGELTRALHYLEETDRMLALKLEDARIQEKREMETFLVVDRATPPQSPAYPNVLLSVPAATVLGGVVGMFYAMFLGYLKVPASRMSTVADEVRGAIVPQPL